MPNIATTRSLIQVSSHLNGLSPVKRCEFLSEFSYFWMGSAQQLDQRQQNLDAAANITAHATTCSLPTPTFMVYTRHDLLYSQNFYSASPYTDSNSGVSGPSWELPNLICGFTGTIIPTEGYYKPRCGIDCREIGIHSPPDCYTHNGSGSPLYEYVKETLSNDSYNFPQDGFLPFPRSLPYETKVFNATRNVNHNQELMNYSRPEWQDSIVAYALEMLAAFPVYGGYHFKFNKEGHYTRSGSGKNPGGAPPPTNGSGSSTRNHLENWTQQGHSSGDNIQAHACPSVPRGNNWDTSTNTPAFPSSSDFFDMPSFGGVLSEGDNGLGYWWDANCELYDKLREVIPVMTVDFHDTGTSPLRNRVQYNSLVAGITIKTGLTTQQAKEKIRDDMDSKIASSEITVLPPGLEDRDATFAGIYDMPCPCIKIGNQG
jgi:hypothetical protein